LRGLENPTTSVKRPQYFGVLTNDIVYKRLAPGVLDELKRVTPKNDAVRPKNKFFQRLTNNIGYPKLREHLGAVVSIMKLSGDWVSFLKIWIACIPGMTNCRLDMLLMRMTVRVSK
jgi:hypothetical protein